MRYPFRYRIFAIDHGFLSFVDVRFEKWPVVLITNPKDAQFFIPDHEPIHRIKRSTHIRYQYTILVSDSLLLIYIFPFLFPLILTPIQNTPIPLLCRGYYKEFYLLFKNSFVRFNFD